MNEYHGIGVMSGTSLDGLDIAHCVFRPKGKFVTIAGNGGEMRRPGPETGWDQVILHVAGLNYPEEWTNRLANLHNSGAEDYARLNVEYGHFLGMSVRNFLDENGIHPDFVACHGHTVFHQPERGFTAQIGDGETMSVHLGCPLVTNFRNKDVAGGGQGAPLVPFGEKHLFSDIRLFLNLGGFANIAGGSAAFDISPCNGVLNWASRLAGSPFDTDGNLARRGEFLPELFQLLNALPHYQQPSPKSLGREWLEREFLPLLSANPDWKPETLLHTCARHIAFQTARAAESLGIRDTPMLITGGGAHNRFLMECIAKDLSPLGIDPVQNTGPFLVDYKEALVFAFLGLQTLLGLPNILPSVTGASVASICGSIHFPANGSWRVVS